MKKNILVISMLLVVLACGKKENTAEVLTPEQETLLVDSIGIDLQKSSIELTQAVDSLTNEVDSLLQGI